MVGRRFARGKPPGSGVRLVGPGLAVPAGIPVVPLQRSARVRWWTLLRAWLGAAQPPRQAAAMAKEAAAQPAADRFQALVEHATDAMLVVDRANEIRSANRKACELFGYAREELIGMNYACLVDPDDLRRLPLQSNAAFAGASLLLERRYVRKDGTRFDGELTNALVDSQSELGIIRDVSERKRTEDELARREREYHLLLQGAYDAIVVIDPEHRIVEANGAMARLLGYTQEELEGRDFISLVEPADLENEPQRIDETFSGVRLSMERRLVRKDGGIVEVELGSARIDARRIFTILRDVTVRNRTQAALAQSEREHRLLMEKASDAIFVVNPEYVIQDVNERAVRLLGYERSDLIGRPYSSIVDRADIAREPLAIGRAFRGESLSLAGRFRRQDGTTVATELSVAPIDARRVQIIARDVSERQAAEAALRESEEMFRTLLEAVFDGILISEGNTIVEVNAALEQLLGYTRSELLGHDVLDLLAPESRPVVRHMRRSATSEPFEITALHKEGRTVYLEGIAQTRLRNGRTLSVKALRDITQRKRDELALRTSEARLREAQEIAKLGSWSLDLAAESVTVSDEFNRIMGLDSKERVLAVERIWPLLHPDDLEDIQRLYQEVLAGWRDGFDVQFRVRKREGREAIVQSRAALVRDADGRGVGMIGTLQDITESAVLERQLVQSMKLEAIGKLTGGVAHDFNNLLTIVVGNLRLLERELEPGNPCLEEALRAAERGSHLVQRLLAYARRQPLQTQPVDVRWLIDETAALLRRTLGETIVVESRVADDLWPAYTDRSQLETALINLALNARDAMPGGGRLLIEVGNRRVPEHPQDTPGRTPGDYVHMAVSDTGTGMAPEVLERACEPFFTTKEVGQGSGLGLSTIYGFAEQCGGFVQLHSSEGQGTTVDLFLPRSAELPPPPRPSAATARTGHGNGQDAAQTVLVVEDDPGVRLVTALTLRTLGYRVLDAPNGRDALRLLEDLPQVDLLLTDIVMPDGPSGIELARQAQQVRPGLPVLLTTGYADALLGPVGSPCSPWPLLPKPYDAEQLQMHLDVVLRPAPMAD